MAKAEGASGIGIGGGGGEVEGASIRGGGGPTRTGVLCGWWQRGWWGAAMRVAGEGGVLGWQGRGGAG